MQFSVCYQVPTTVCFEALMLRFERFVSILQLRYKLVKLVLDAFWQFVQLRPLQNLEQDDRHLLLTRENKRKIQTNHKYLSNYFVSQSSKTAASSATWRRQVT